MREGIIHENTYISFYLFKILTSQIFASKPKFGFRKDAIKKNYFFSGHLPSKVIDANMTIFDLTSEDDTPIIKDILDERDSNNFMDQIERHHKEYFVHMEKGGANIIHNERARYELVKLSGYFAKWSSSNGSLDPCEDSKNCTDENCLPGMYICISLICDNF